MSSSRPGGCFSCRGGRRRRPCRRHHGEILNRRGNDGGRWNCRGCLTGQNAGRAVGVGIGLTAAPLEGGRSGCCNASRHSRHTENRDKGREPRFTGWSCSVMLHQIFQPSRPRERLWEKSAMWRFSLGRGENRASRRIPSVRRT